MLETIRGAAKNLLDLGAGRVDMWTNARMAFAEVPVDRAAARRWLPFPLTTERNARATVFIADYPQTTFGCVYREAAVLLHARLGALPVVFCPWMVVDDDRAMILGRELLGYPKKMAEISFTEADGRFTGSVRRRGEEVMRIEGAVGGEVHAPPPGIGRWAVNLRTLIGFRPGHLLMFRPAEQVHACQELDARVVLRSGPSDPLGIATGEATRATMRTCNIGARMLPPPLPIFPVGAAFAVSQFPLRVH